MFEGKRADPGAADAPRAHRAQREHLLLINVPGEKSRDCRPVDIEAAKAIPGSVATFARLADLNIAQAVHF